MELLVALAVMILTGILLRKRFEIRTVMFGAGILLMFAAILMGHPILPEDRSTGFAFFDVFRAISQAFTNQVGGAGFIIMLLFGYTAYMKEIGADVMTVRMLSLPLTYLKFKSLLVPVFFLIGNLLCIVIPSASSLSVMLMSTAYPILVGAGVSPMAVGAVIAMSAMIAPTPLGIDNILASEALGMGLNEYTFQYHALVSIPVTLVLAAVHYFWQRWCDKRETDAPAAKVVAYAHKSQEAPKLYAILPMLPLLLMIGAFAGGLDQIAIGEVTLFSLFLAIICEGFRRRTFAKTGKQAEAFFKGMGSGFATVVVQVVAALTFVEGLRALGVIDTLSSYISGMEGAGLLTVLTFTLFVLIVGTISGSGLALFFAFVDLVPAFAAAAGIAPVMLMIPMQFTAHFVKSLSPLAPAIVITASMMGVAPMKLIKRTSVPSAVGIVLSIILSYFLF